MRIITIMMGTLFSITGIYLMSHEATKVWYYHTVVAQK